MKNNRDFVIKNGVLTKYKGPGGDVAIPESVRSIGGNAFWGCTSLTNVTIPAGVTEIGGWVFEGCGNLTIHAPAGSRAEEYAKEYKIHFETTSK